MSRKKQQIFRLIKQSFAVAFLMIAFLSFSVSESYAEDCSDVYTPLSSFVVTGVNNNRSFYQQASSQTGVPWEMLAAIHYRETNFSHSNPSNGQGIFQFVNGEGGPYPPGPVSDAEFMRQLNFMAEKVQSVYAIRNSPNPASVSPRRLTADEQDINLIKNALYSYNGRATVYANQATQYGYNATVQPFEGSPYVMNRFDCQRARMGIITQDYGGLDGKDTRYGAFTIYARLKGDVFWRSFSAPYRWSYVTQMTFTSSERTTEFNLTSTSSPGGKIYATLQARNTGSSSWSRQNLKLGTSRLMDRSSLFYDSTWPDPARAANLKQETVAPGEIGTFEFVLKSPLQTGSYNEYFNLVADGVTWLNDPGLFYTINVNNPSGPSNFRRTGMSPGETLDSTDRIMSPDSQSVLTVDRDGGIRLRSSNLLLWQKYAEGKGSTRLVMQTDGNLVLYSQSNLPIWASNTDGNAGAWLALQTDGNLVVYSQSNLPIWASNTKRVPDGLDYVNTTLRPGNIMYVGQNIATADRNYWLTLQVDGNVVLYSASKGAIWATGTSGKSVSFMALQSDGNLVLYSSEYKPLWASHTDGRGVQRLVLQPDGNLVMYRSNNTPAWATNTVQR